MKILISGSGGLVGSAALAHLNALGHYVVRLVRANPVRDRGDILWDPVAGSIERKKLEGFDAVLHLGGESLLNLWTASNKERMVNSRVQGTEFLAQTLAGLTAKPKVFACASAIGYYGDRGEEWLSETSKPGRGFLAELCEDWEKAADFASSAGIRVVHLRFGIILSDRGGALKAMLPPFLTGLGGPLGSGRQYMSWISLTDVAKAIAHILEKDSLRGAVNITAPNPVTNKDFSRALGRVLHRPAILPVPSFILKALPGGMGREFFLASSRVEPAKLRMSGYRFEYPDVEQALRQTLGRD